MAERINQPPPEEDAGVKHISLTPDIGSRDGTLTRDPKMVNCYPEQTALGIVAVKRPGTGLVRQYPVGIAQGQFTFNNIPHAVTRDKVYNTLDGTSIDLPGIVANYLPMTFLSDVPIGHSLIKSEVCLWKREGVSTLIQVTDPSYPGNTVPGITYLDGFFFVMSIDGFIQHSSSLDVMTWPPLNFLKSDAMLGQPKAISRHLNYIATFHAAGVQMFYNAGNATGSVLSPVGSASWRIGCVAGESVLNINDETYFIAQQGTRGRSVQKITGLSMAKISTPFIDKILARSNFVQTFTNDIRVDGHSFYSITLIDLGITVVYDTLLGTWVVWSSTTGGVEGAFTGVYSITRGSRCLLQGYEDGKVLELSPTLYQDVSGPIAVRIVTPCHDWGTLKRKYMPAVFLIADTVDSTVQLRYSDEDYASPSNWRSIDLSSKRKMALKMGSSVRRSWEVLHTANTPFRGFTLQIDIARGAD